MTDIELEPEEPEAPAPSGGNTPATETLLRQIIEIVENARSMPMSATVMVSRDEVLDLLDEAVERLPEELRSARWLLKERDELMAKAQRDAELIIDDAKARVARMVERQEVVKAAHAHARSVVDEAEASARRTIHQAEDFCDQRLASFEVVLDRVTRTVKAGRQRLAATVEQSELGQDDQQGDDDNGFFDQEAD